MDAVLGDVLQAPFWPDFAIIFAGSKFKLSHVSAMVSVTSLDSYKFRSICIDGLILFLPTGHTALTQGLWSEQS